MPHTEISYKVDAVFSSANDCGVNAADPALKIRWPIEAGAEVMSDKDRALPMLRNLCSQFS